MECILLAGGKGTRLRSAVPSQPKPLADIAGRPFLDHLLDSLLKHSCNHVVLSICYLGDQIRDHIGDTYRGCPVSYATESTPLGTGGAIRHALKECAEQSVFVLNGDTLLDLDFAAMAAAHDARRTAIAMALRSVSDVARYGAVTTDASDTVVQMGEKSAHGQGWINAGVYRVKRTLFDSRDLPESFSFETDFLASHIEELRPFGFKTDGYFIDIGIPEDLHRARAEMPQFLRRSEQQTSDGASPAGSHALCSRRE